MDCWKYYRIRIEIIYCQKVASFLYVPYDLEHEYDRFNSIFNVIEAKFANKDNSDVLMLLVCKIADFCHESKTFDGLTKQADWRTQQTNLTSVMKISINK